MDTAFTDALNDDPAHAINTYDLWTTDTYSMFIKNSVIFMQIF